MSNIEKAHAEHAAAKEQNLYIAVLHAADGLALEIAELPETTSYLKVFKVVYGTAQTDQMYTISMTSRMLHELRRWANLDTPTQRSIVGLRLFKSSIRGRDRLRFPHWEIVWPNYQSQEKK